MALAQRLNELATANSEGLLKYALALWLPAHFVTNISSDDEYRLLRQNVFEQYSSNAVIPVESPIVPIVRVRIHGEPLLCLSTLPLL